VTAPAEAAFRSLTMVFPMWNEEAYVRRTVAAAIELGEELVADRRIGAFDVLLVDDASTDDTGAIADGLAAADPRVRPASPTPPASSSSTPTPTSPSTSARCTAPSACSGATRRTS
jgi:hypothetical protein